MTASDKDKIAEIILQRMRTEGHDPLKDSQWLTAYLGAVIKATETHPLEGYKELEAVKPKPTVLSQPLCPPDIVVKPREIITLMSCECCGSTLSSQDGFWCPRCKKAGHPFWFYGSATDGRYYEGSYQQNGTSWDDIPKAYEERYEPEVT